MSSFRQHGTNPNVPATQSSSQYMQASPTMNGGAPSRDSSTPNAPSGATQTADALGKALASVSERFYTLASVNNFRFCDLIALA